jgi:hypothetical protein
VPDQSIVKLIEVVPDTPAHGASPEKIHSQYVALSVAQIHAALSYSSDHQQVIDATIEKQLGEVEALRAQAGESALPQRLRV